MSIETGPVKLMQLTDLMFPMGLSQIVSINAAKGRIIV